MFGKNSSKKTTSKKLDTSRSNGHLIELRQVVKTFESDAGIFVALDGIDLQVPAGKFVSIIGKSGSGKSTLLNMVTGIDKPTAGEVHVNGTAVHTLGEEAIAVWRGRNIGVIFQFFQLLPTLTSVENVLLAMDKAAEIGLTTIGITGYQGGKLREKVDVCVATPADTQHPDGMQHVEDGQWVVLHAIFVAIRQWVK